MGGMMHDSPAFEVEALATRTEGRKSRVLQMRDQSQQSSSPEIDGVNGGATLLHSKVPKRSPKVAFFDSREALQAKEERTVALAFKLLRLKAIIRPSSLTLVQNQNLQRNSQGALSRFIRKLSAKFQVK